MTTEQKKEVWPLAEGPLRWIERNKNKDKPAGDYNIEEVATALRTNNYSYEPAVRFVCEFQGEKLTPRSIEYNKRHWQICTDPEYRKRHTVAEDDPLYLAMCKMIESLNSTQLGYVLDKLSQ